MTTEPSFVIELPVGSLAIHDMTVSPAGESAPVVLAIHGITANGKTWEPVAEELHRRHGPGAVRVLAPDLRGRAASRTAPGPYGLAAHAEDLATIVGVFGVRPLLVGHSMGGFVSALAGAQRPDLYEGVVLVDGGLAFPAPPGLDIDAALQAVIGPAMERLSMRFTDEDDYLRYWDEHPAMGPILRGPTGDAVRRYLVHDLVPSPDAPARLMSSCILEAVKADGADVLADPVTHAAARRGVEQGVPTELIWAERGLMDESQGLYDEGRLAALDLPPELSVQRIGGNHYGAVLDGSGPPAVADAVDRRLGLG